MPSDNGKITAEELAYIKDDYRRSKQRKKETQHVVWRRLTQAYRVSKQAFWDFYDYVVNTNRDRPENDAPAQLEASMESMDGRLASLNVYLRKFVALMSFQDPQYIVDNHRPGDEPYAWLLEKAWGSLAEKIKHPRMLKQMLFYGGMTGTAVVKTGYKSQFVYNEIPLADDSMPDGVPDDPLLDAFPKQEVTEYDATIVGEHPFSIVVPSYDIFFDTQARVLSEVRVIYHRTSRRVRDVMLDLRYNESARAKVRGERHSDYDDSTYPTQEGEVEDDMRRVDVVEAFDVGTKKYMVFCEDVDEPLRHWTPLDLPIDNPYHFFQPVPDPESCWGIPYILLMYPQSLARDRISAAVVDAIARHGKKVHLFGREVDPATIEAINNARDNTCIKDPNMTSEELRNSMVTLEFGKVDPEVFQLRSMIENDQNFMSGLADSTLNVNRPGEQTATEVASRNQGQSLTIEDMRDSYEEAVEDIGKDLFKIMLDRWDDAELVKYVGYDPRIYFWTRLEREKLLGNFTLKVRVGSTQKVSPEVRRRQMIDSIPRMIELDNAIANQRMRPPNAATPINLEELARTVAEEIDPRLADKILNRRDPITLLERLVLQNAKFPVNVSPDALEALAQTNPELATELGWVPRQQPMMPPPMPNMGMPMPNAGMPPAPMPMGGPPQFEVRNGMPAQPMVNPLGQMPMESPAGIGGRMFSESMGM